MQTISRSGGIRSCMTTHDVSRPVSRYAMWWIKPHGTEGLDTCPLVVLVTRGGCASTRLSRPSSPVHHEDGCGREAGQMREASWAGSQEGPPCHTSAREALK